MELWLLGQFSLLVSAGVLKGLYAREEMWCVELGRRVGGWGKGTRVHGGHAEVLLFELALERWEGVGGGGFGSHGGVRGFLGTGAIMT